MKLAWLLPQWRCLLPQSARSNSLVPISYVPDRFVVHNRGGESNSIQQRVPYESPFYAVPYCNHSRAAHSTQRCAG
jgi:hypothetical protein